MAYLDSELNKLKSKCNKNENNITDTQIGLTETYQKALKADATITDVQLALVELYEMMLGGN